MYIIHIGQPLQGIILPPSSHQTKWILPFIIIWDPITSWGIDNAECPLCQSGVKITAEGWTDSATSSTVPRRLYGLQSIVYLISRIYKCPACNSNILAHDPRQPYTAEAPFILFHKCGVTKKLGNMIFSLVNHGLAIQRIESILCEQYWLTHSARLSQFQKSYSQEQSYASFEEFLPTNADLISNNLLYNSYLQMFFLVEPKYCADMQSLLADKWISFDHTFKIANNIGYKREGSWVNQYNSCFIVTNEKGQVIGWQFTMGTSTKEVGALLKGHARAGKNIAQTCVDNCCQARVAIQKHLGDDIKVFLDLFSCHRAS